MNWFSHDNISLVDCGTHKINHDGYSSSALFFRNKSSEPKKTEWFFCMFRFVHAERALHGHSLDTGNLSTKVHTKLVLLKLVILYTLFFSHLHTTLFVFPGSGARLEMQKKMINDFNIFFSSFSFIHHHYGFLTNYFSAARTITRKKRTAKITTKKSATTANTQEKSVYTLWDDFAAMKTGGQWAKWEKIFVFKNWRDDRYSAEVYLVLTNRIAILELQTQGTESQTHEYTSKWKKTT